MMPKSSAVTTTIINDLPLAHLGDSCQNVKKENNYSNKPGILETSAV